VEDSALSLIPPLLALGMVMLTKRVLLSLGTGIIAGALLLNNFHISDALERIVRFIISIFYVEGHLNDSELLILFFLLLLGMISALVIMSGGSRAFGEWALKRVKTRVGAQFITTILGMIIFIDDYFNSLTVGNVSRPLTDRHRISRAKLAYIVDSTSAPVCVISPVSSWGAYIISILAGILTTYSVFEYEALKAFIIIVPMNYYAIIALLMVFVVAYYKLDFGSMRVHEARAIIDGQLVDPKKGDVLGEQGKLFELENGKVSNLVLPIVSLIIGTLSAMVWTGIRGSEGEITILSIFENVVVEQSLVYGGLIGLAVSLLMLVGKGVSFKTVQKTLWTGIRSMLPAIYILIFAWTIVSIIGELGTGKYLASMINDNINIALLPALIFVVAGIMALSTGTSWGTFGMLLPIAADIAAVIEPSMLLPMLAAVLAGSIFGDHCSPISDTTILSATGAGCDHIDHVMTQLPYAIVVALISFIGFLVLGFTKSMILGLIATLVLFIVVIVILKKFNSPIAE